MTPALCPALPGAALPHYSPTEQGNRSALYDYGNAVRRSLLPRLWAAREMERHPGSASTNTGGLLAVWAAMQLKGFH